MPHTGTSFLEGLVAGAGRVSSVTGARLEVSSEPSLTLLLLLLLLVLLLLIDHHLMMLIIIWVPPHDGKIQRHENTHRWSGGVLART